MDTSIRYRCDFGTCIGYYHTWQSFPFLIPPSGYSIVAYRPYLLEWVRRDYCLFIRGLSFKEFSGCAYLRNDGNPFAFFHTRLYLSFLRLFFSPYPHIIIASLSVHLFLPLLPDGVTITTSET